MYTSDRENSSMSHSTHNMSFQRWDIPGNDLHWYWQLKTNKRKYTTNTNRKKTKQTNWPQI